MPTTNGHPAETGCYIDSHWGQYGPDRLADVAESFGWTAPSADDTQRGLPDDPRAWRERAQLFEDAAYRYDGDERQRRMDDAATAWECHHESADAIEQWLNDHTPSVCPYCGQPVQLTDSGAWWTHVGLQGECEYRMMDSARHYVWHWHDGDFCLSPMCNDPDECTDDTCAHWD